MIDVKFTYVNCAVCFNKNLSHFPTDNLIGSLIETQMWLVFESPWQHFPPKLCSFFYFEDCEDTPPTQYWRQGYRRVIGTYIE